MSDFDLILDDENELKFAVTIEGAEKGKPSARLHLSTNKGYDLIFEGESDGSGELSVVVPPLKNVISEGAYDAELEVIIDDRVFKPLSLTANFKRAVKVEAVVRNVRRSTKTEVKAQVLTESSPKQKVKTQIKKEPEKKASLDDLIDVLGR